MRHFNYNVVKIRTEDGKDWRGIPALHGKTLYETALEHGFEGTEDEWFELLIGDGWITPLQNFQAEYDAYVKANDAKIKAIEARTINGHVFNKSITLVPNDIGAADKSLSNVSNQDFALKAEQVGIGADGIVLTQTYRDGDNIVYQTDSSGAEKITVRNDDGTVTEEHKLPNGETYKKLIVRNSDGSITESFVTE